MPSKSGFIPLQELALGADTSGFVRLHVPGRIAGTLSPLIGSIRVICTGSQ
jgi:hypothetical protein